MKESGRLLKHQLLWKLCKKVKNWKKIETAETTDAKSNSANTRGEEHVIWVEIIPDNFQEASDEL